MARTPSSSAPHGGGSGAVIGTSCLVLSSDCPPDCGAWHLGLHREQNRGKDQCPHPQTTPAPDAGSCCHPTHPRLGAGQEGRSVPQWTQGCPVWGGWGAQAEEVPRHLRDPRKVLQSFNLLLYRLGSCEVCLKARKCSLRWPRGQRAEWGAERFSRFSERTRRPARNTGPAARPAAHSRLNSLLLSASSWEQTEGLP